MQRVAGAQPGAAARTTLEHAAAGQWGVPEGEVQGRNHFVVHTKSNRRIPYGELIPLVDDLHRRHRRTRLVSRLPTQFRYIGKDMPLVRSGPDLVRGKGMFGIDAKMPGMVYATIATSSGNGRRNFSRLDDSAAKQVNGVQQVVMLDLAQAAACIQALGGAAVVANNTWARAAGT